MCLGEPGALYHLHSDRKATVLSSAMNHLPLYCPVVLCPRPRSPLRSRPSPFSLPVFVVFLSVRSFFGTFEIEFFAHF